MVSVNIDGQEIEVEEETTILNAAKKLGIHIPTLCYNEFIEPYGACRLCTVEVVRGKRTRLVTACNYPLRDPVTVYTKSDKVIQLRRMNLELLMAQAPAAEAIQKLAKEMGVERTRFPIANPDEKCILCGLCVQVCDELVGVNAINFVNLGPDREVSIPNKVESEVCIGCGACAYFCPTGAITIEDAQGRNVLHDQLYLGPTNAIRVPFLQAIPNVPIIDTEACIHFKTEGCKICEEVCEPEAINHKMTDEYQEIDVGAIVLATGYELLDSSALQSYGYGKLPNVLTSLEFEHLCHASGPTGGKLLLQDGSEPKTIGIIHCVGSRDKNYKPYCSRLCCMYALKFSHLVKEKTSANVYEFYIDIRAPGKGYEEFYNRMLEEDVTFIRGKVAEVSEVAEIPDEEGRLILRCEDTLLGMVRRIPVDMVILCPAIVSQKNVEELARLFGINCSEDGFFRELHPKLAPVNTAADGIFIAGACQSPKDIPDSVAQGAGAAGAVLSLGDTFSMEPIYSVIDEELCAGCKVCISVCPYDAISFDEEKKVSMIQETLCKGCGACVAACPSGASYQKSFRDEQIMAEIEGALAY